MKQRSFWSKPIANTILLSSAWIMAVSNTQHSIPSRGWRCAIPTTDRMSSTYSLAGGIVDNTPYQAEVDGVPYLPQTECLLHAAWPVDLGQHSISSRGWGWAIHTTDRTSDNLAPLKTRFNHAPACLMCTIHAHEPMNSHWLPPRQYKFNQASSDIFSIFSFCSFFVVTLFNTVMSLRSTVGVQVLLLLIGFI